MLDSYSPHANLPPRNSATDPGYAVYSAATAAAATTTSLWATYTTPDGDVNVIPKGKVWIELEAVAQDVYVRFCRTGTTATTTSNGAIVKVGVPRYFYIDPTKDLFLDHIAAGVGVIKWRITSQIGERNRH